MELSSDNNIKLLKARVAVLETLLKEQELISQLKNKSIEAQNEYIKICESVEQEYSGFSLDKNSFELVPINKENKDVEDSS